MRACSRLELILYCFQPSKNHHHGHYALVSNCFNPLTPAICPRPPGPNKAVNVSLVVTFVGSQSLGKLPSSQLRRTLPPRTPMCSRGKMYNRSRRRSRSLFLGNMPETAWRMICVAEKEQTSVLGAWDVWGGRDTEREPTYLVRLPNHHILIRRLLQSTRVHRVLAVQQLLVLPSRHLHLSRVRDNHIVSTVD